MGIIQQDDALFSLPPRQRPIPWATLQAQFMFRNPQAILPWLAEHRFVVAPLIKLLPEVRNRFGAETQVAIALVRIEDDPSPRLCALIQSVYQQQDAAERLGGLLDEFWAYQPDAVRHAMVLGIEPAEREP